MKRLLTGALLVFIVATATLGAFVATLDLNEYKTELVNELQSATGRKVEILGEIGLKPALTPTLKVEGFKIGNPAWAQNPWLLASDQAFVKIAIAPIFTGKIELRRIALQGISVNLETNAKGEKSWQFTTETPETEEPSDLGWVDVRALEISDVDINYLVENAPNRTFELNRVRVQQQSSTTVAIEADIAIQDEMFSITGTTSLLSALTANRDFAFSLQVNHSAHHGSIDGRAQSPLEAPNLQAEVSANTDNLGKLLGLAGVDAALDAPFAVSAAIAADKTSLSAENISLVSNESRMSGQAKITLTETRMAVKFQLNGEFLDLDALLAEQNSGEQAPPSRAFPATPLPFSALADTTINGTISIDDLRLANLSITEFASTIESADTVTRLSDTGGKLAGGSLTIGANVDLVTKDNPKVDIALKSKSLQLAALSRGENSGVAKSGVLNLDIEIRGQGDSPAKIMAASNGFVNVDISNAELESGAAALAAGDLLLNLLNGLNPLSNESATRIECATIRLPIKNGVAANDTGIGIRTAQLNILGGGQVDLDSEKIAFKAKPKPRKGIGLNVASLADFVGIGGTLMAPRPATDTKGLATAGVKVGAALATGGLSLLAEGLFDRASSDVDVCAVARGEASIEASQAAQKKEKPSVLESTGNKIKGAFEGLFGK